MKNIKSYEQINEAKQSQIYFQTFIDYMSMNLSDFKKRYNDDNNWIGDDMLNKLKELKGQCKVEDSFDPREIPFSTKLKTKYPHVYLFGQDIGEPTVYVISSSLDNLLKLVEKPDNM